MKLVEMKCSRCGAVLKLRKDGSEAKCDFCGAIYKIDDEDHNAEQRGYEAEKGRIRAREEAKAEAIQERIDKINEAREAQLKEQRKIEKIFSWFIAWLICFPLPVTLLIWPTKLKKSIKIPLIIIAWIAYIVLLYIFFDNI